MKPNLKLLSVPSTLCVALVAGCSNSSSGSVSTTVVNESEPNDTTPAAGTLRVGETGSGTVADEMDTDFWKVSLSTNQVISVEVFANRVDQAAWFAGTNAAMVRIFDTDGVTTLLQQSDEDFDWSPDQDTDILSFRAPAAGTYYVQVDVATAPGAGGDYLVSILPSSLMAPLQSEIELEGVFGANDDDATAEMIVPGTMYGFHVDDESDWYEFDVAVESLVTFTVKAHRNGVWQGDDSYYDPEINLYDSVLNNLDNDDDSFYLDSSIHYLITTPGTYFLEVNECCGTGDAGYYLEFTLEPVSTLSPVAEVEPNDVMGTAQAVQFGDLISGRILAANEDFYSIACNAGDRIYIQVFDADNYELAAGDVTVALEDSMANVQSADFNLGGLQFHRTILKTAGTFFVHVTSSVATDYRLRITQTPAAFETEPNNTLLNAGTFTNGTAAGLMDMAADLDIFTFQATAGVPVFFDAIADNIGPNGFFEHDGFGSQLAPVLTVLDGASMVLTTSDATLSNAVGVKNGLPSVSLAFVPTTTGTYYVQIEDKAAAFGTDFHYVLEMR